MIINLYSDIHRETDIPARPFALPAVSGDVLIFAGDIDIGRSGIEWAGSVAQGRHVIYVPGNHEYYCSDISILGPNMRHESRRLGIHYLDNDEAIIDGVRFLGSTLWSQMTDITCDQIEDFDSITVVGEQFSPEIARDLHQKSVDWLTCRLSEKFDGETVVITHYAPSRRCINPEKSETGLSSAFTSDLDHLVELADIWCYGHTHYNVDTMIGHCRLISNQRGYISDALGTAWERRFKPKLQIDLNHPASVPVHVS